MNVIARVAIEQLQAAGFTVEERNGAIKVTGSGKPSQAALEALRSHKEGALEWIATQERMENLAGELAGLTNRKTREASTRSFLERLGR